MKLKELAIDGFGARHDLQLGRFGDGLTIVYGENGAGKTTVREFVRGTLFDIDKKEALPPNALYSAGRLNVTYGPDEFQLSRDVQMNSAVDVRPLTNLAGTAWIDRVNSLSRLTGSLNSELYDSVFSVSFRETANNAQRLAHVLRTQLEVPCGPESAGDESAHANWLRESKTRKQQAESLRARIDALTVEKSGYLSQIESAKTGWQGRIDEVERQISHVLNRLNEMQISPRQNQLQQIENEIAQLRLLIETQRNQVTYVAPADTEFGHRTTIYQRLDDIDHQIRRWRDVQSDIQNQRLRLRDEMLVWNELTLESDEHPYHNARAILVSLESKVDEAERNANHWGDAAASRVDTSQMARTLGQLCQTMRDDLYGLCNELSHQYKHIRHKAAAAELKQLRRCYGEMGENIQRLIQRRESVIREIREFDPAGADAIIRADIKFFECAQHEGYLEARKRFVGQVTEPAVHVNPPDLNSEHARMATLEHQRQQLLATHSHLESEHNDLNQRHADLVRQRDALRNQPDCHQLNLKIQNIDGQLHLVTSEHAVLLRQIEKDRNYVSVQPDALVLVACGILKRLTDGDLTQVFLIEELKPSVREPQVQLQVRDRHGKVLNFSAIDNGLQDQVYLSLMLSAKKHLQQKGVLTPTLIDDAFIQIPSERITSTLNVLNDFATQGHQIVALTQHRYLVDRIPGVPLLELPPTMPSTQPMNTPDRRSTTAPVVAPIPDVDWNPDAFSPIQPNTTSALPRPYPLSKYSHAGLHQGAADFDEMIAVPFPVSGQQQATSYDGPRLHSDVPPRQRVASVSVNSVGDRLGYAAGIDESTYLDKLGFFDSRQLRALQSHGIDRVADMLDLEIEQASSLGFNPEQMNRWQSQLWLLTNLPGIRINDVRVLVACGVTDPEQLDTSHPQQILDRIERFFATSEGRRFAGDRDRISLDRVNGWYRSLDATRLQWENRRRASPSNYERASKDRDYSQSPSERRRHSSRPVSSDEAARAYRPIEREPRSPREMSDNDHQRPERAARASRPAREPRLARPPRMNTPRPERKVVPRVAPVSKLSAEQSAPPRPNEKKPAVVNRKLKFYLDLNDHIEAAPSIGPKTAERFEKIEVVTVSDFLKQTAESMATKIKYKRISADVIRDWQHQARLVCRVPNLRGHDAQLLVACGVTEPEELSTMQPKSLFEIIGPFSETKEGLKIIRNGKKPDLAEITDWISWAEQTRSLQAA